MLTASASILIVYLIILPVHSQLTDDEIVTCRQQTQYDLYGVKWVSVELYYDADQTALDFDFVKAMCAAREKISHGSFKFYVGLSTKIGLESGLVECYNKDKSKDCTYSYAVACAYRLVDDFSQFVCCTAAGGSPPHCVQAQNPKKMKEFNKCTQQKHPTIQPHQVLLDNAQLARGIDPYFSCLPIMVFNGINDQCARFLFPEIPVDVICAMLVDNTDKACLL